MAELRKNPYRSGLSALHRLDVRMKLALLAAASLVCLRLEFAALGLLALTALALGFGCRRELQARPGEIGWLACLLLLVFAARALSTEGEPQFSMGTVAVTREGLREGALACLRLGLVFALGAVFLATTRSSRVRAAIHWFLRPLPWIPAERVATMLGLLLRFLPLIREQTALTADAQRARAVENRRNPVYRLVRFGLPLMRRLFVTTDQLVLAMDARCYSESRTGPGLAAGREDWTVFAAGCAGLALLLAV